MHSHCGQILQKNPGKGQSPPPPTPFMPVFWEHLEPQLSLNPVTKEDRDWLLGGFLFGTEMGERGGGGYETEVWETVQFQINNMNLLHIYVICM